MLFRAFLLPLCSPASFAEVAPDRVLVFEATFKDSKLNIECG